MNKKRLWFVLIIAALVLVKLGSFASASRNDLSRSTLRGLNGIGLEIRGVSSEIEKDGLTKDQIQSDVELKLRIAGIKVLSQKEWREEEGRPYLYVSLTIKKLGDEFYVCSLALSLCQHVILWRNSSTHALFPTWSTGELCCGPLGFIRNRIKTLMNVFLHDYLAVNRRLQKEKSQTHLHNPWSLRITFQKEEFRDLLKEKGEVG